MHLRRLSYESQACSYCYSLCSLFLAMHQVEKRLPQPQPEAESAVSCIAVIGWCKLLHSVCKLVKKPSCSGGDAASIRVRTAQQSAAFVLLLCSSSLTEQFGTWQGQTRATSINKVVEAFLG